MRLLNAISVLSKSSLYAVSTERKTDITNNDFDKIKTYLYVEMPIVEDVSAAISCSIDHKKILFLCGSSGDGKSEILTKLKSKYKSNIKFHLDATHSFNPHENAIQTLDAVFEDYEANRESLVVGINVGMLGNYAEEGNVTNIQKAIKTYLDSKNNSEGIEFINFEDYPKFEITGDGYKADFAEKILTKITSKKENPIWKVYEEDCENYIDIKSRKIQANYALLCVPSVQKVIIELLLKARLLSGQFLTARGLLDFVYGLVASDGSFHDNLFEGCDNELANKMSNFDPASIRTKQIDRFILAHELGIHEQKFKDFEDSIKAFIPTSLPNAQSYLRLFYLLRHEDLGNNFHHTFHEDFKDEILENYIEVFRLHKDYDGEKEHRSKLKKFYNETLRFAVRKYNNRVVNKLAKNQYLISEIDGYQIAAKLDIKMNSKALQTETPHSISSFDAFLTVGDEKLSISVNANLFGLMHKVIDGYRPNKHDKNTVILLDELNDELAQIANRSGSLEILHADENYRVQFIDEEEFEVSGYYYD